MSYRYRIDVAYDGTQFVGWQVQPNGVSIQQRIEEALCRLTGDVTKVHGSGRTDQGVHARRQVAHFDLRKPVPVASLRRALNGLLPPDIRILRSAVAAPDFHARRSAVGKEYRYFIWCGDVLPPCLRLYRCHVRRPLDVGDMRMAAERLQGVHDFAAFSARSQRELESTVRVLHSLKVLKRGAEIVIVARGSGFLYRMVRSLAGFLIRVGEGSLPPEQAETILKSCERTASVPTARPQGLFLWNVFY